MLDIAPTEYEFAVNWRRRQLRRIALSLEVVALMSVSTAAMGQPVATPQVAPATAQASTTAASTTAGVPPGYTIGLEDVLSVTFWKEPDMSVDSVVVRPDGKISLPLLNELDAASLTPDQLRAVITERAEKFVADPTVSVVVREIRSRRVFITGSVANPGAFPLGGGTTVLQLIALAGGLTEFANKKNIVVTRLENERTVVLPFNYSDITKGKNLHQNVLLKPGDTVVVP